MAMEVVGEGGGVGIVVLGLMVGPFGHLVLLCALALVVRV